MRANYQPQEYCGFLSIDQPTVLSAPEPEKKSEILCITSIKSNLLFLKMGTENRILSSEINTALIYIQMYTAYLHPNVRAA